MKKLVFMFVAMAAISFASCGEKKAAAVEEVGEDTTVVEAPACACDTCACDTCNCAAE